jgi:tetratricopeptide (TPR) repeat protein
MGTMFYRVICAATLASGLLLGGCTSTPHETLQSSYDAQLLSGQPLFGEEIDVSEFSSYDILAIDQKMKTMVSEKVNPHHLNLARIKRLLSELDKEGYFQGTYRIAETRTAQDTFYARSGNCLSYTNMFIALAREAGLNAHYQIVQVPPTWDAESGYLIRNNHVNVVVRDIRSQRFNRVDFTVDFNSLQPAAEYDRRVITDRYAESLFYANLFVDEYVAGNHRAAFVRLKQAIIAAPENPDLWVNLGAFYNTHNRADLALKAFQMSLKIEPDNKPAWSGLERSYTALGEMDLAGLYGDKVRSYRVKNPYYHYALAQAAYRTQDYSLALESIDRAIDLNSRDGRFHYLKALSYSQMGDEKSYQKYLRKARDRLAREQANRRAATMAVLTEG